MKGKKSKRSKEEANHPWKRQRGRTLMNNFNVCVMQSAATPRYCLPRQVNEGTRKEQVPARIMLVEAHSPLGALIRAFLRGAAQQQHCRQDCSDRISSYISVTVPLAWCSGGNTAPRHRCIHVECGYRSTDPQSVRYDAGPPTQLQRHSTASPAAWVNCSDFHFLEWMLL